MEIKDYKTKKLKDWSRRATKTGLATDDREDDDKDGEKEDGKEEDDDGRCTSVFFFFYVSPWRQSIDEKIAIEKERATTRKKQENDYQVS